MKEYEVQDWRKLLDHATAGDGWIQPPNQDALVKQLLLLFYPLVKGKRQAKMEQVAYTMALTGYEMKMLKLKSPSPEIEAEKLEGAKFSLEDHLASIGLDRGVIEKRKQKADRFSFKWRYQTSDFGDTPECPECNRLVDFKWRQKKGDWTVSCPSCGWHKTFTKSWIDKEFRRATRAAERWNAEQRAFSAREDEYSFYLPLQKIFVPEKNDSYAAVLSVN